MEKQKVRIQFQMLVFFHVESIKYERIAYDSFRSEVGIVFFSFFSCQEFNVSTSVRLKGEVSIKLWLLPYMSASSFTLIFMWSGINGAQQSKKYKVCEWITPFPFMHRYLLCIRFMRQTSDSHQVLYGATNLTNIVAQSDLTAYTFWWACKPTNTAKSFAFNEPLKP